MGVSTVLKAVPALIAYIVKPDDQSGGVVKLLDSAQLIAEGANLRIPT